METSGDFARLYETMHIKALGTDPDTQQVFHECKILPSSVLITIIITTDLSKTISHTLHWMPDTLSHFLIYSFQPPWKVGALLLLLLLPLLLLTTFYQ